MPQVWLMPKVVQRLLLAPKPSWRAALGTPAARQELTDGAGYPKPETFRCQAPQVCLGVQLKHPEEVLIQSY